MGPEMVRQFLALIDDIEAHDEVKVVAFDSAVDGFFLNHSDFTARIEDLTSMPVGLTGLPPWPDFLARLTRAPVASSAVSRFVSRNARRTRILDLRVGYSKVAPSPLQAPTDPQTQRD